MGLSLKDRTIILIVLVSLLPTLIVASVLLYLFGFIPLSQAVPLSISQINSDPEFWVGKRVSVQGILKGPLIFIPERVPPYNYLLRDPNTQASIGVLWKEYGTSFEGKTVTVVGIMRKGFTRPLIVTTVYYIEAEFMYTHSSD